MSINPGNNTLKSRDILIYLWNIDKNVCTERMAFTVFKIVIKKGPQTPWIPNPILPIIFYWSGWGGVCCTGVRRVGVIIGGEGHYRTHRKSLNTRVWGLSGCSAGPSLATIRKTVNAISSVVTYIRTDISLVGSNVHFLNGN